MIKKVEKVVITIVCVAILGVGLYLVKLVEPFIKGCDSAFMVVGILFMTLTIWTTIKWCEITNKINGYE